MGVCILQKKNQYLGRPWWECNKWKDPTWSKIWHPFASPGKLALLQTTIGYQGRQWQIILQGPERARSVCLEKQINPNSELRLKKIYRAQWCICFSLGRLWWLATEGYPHWFTSPAIWGHSKLRSSYYTTFSHFLFYGLVWAEKNWTMGWGRIKNKQEREKESLSEQSYKTKHKSLTAWPFSSHDSLHRRINQGSSGD